jgi:hypothetical protein
MRKLFFYVVCLAISIGSVTAFDYRDYNTDELKGDFLINFDLGADGIIGLYPQSTVLAPAFHMEMNMTFVPLPAWLHFDFDMGSIKSGELDDLLVTLGGGLDAPDLFGQNFGLGAGCFIGGPTSATSFFTIPYVRTMYRFTTGLVSDGFYLDCLLHAEAGYAIATDGISPSFPIFRFGIAVGYIGIME